MSFSPRSEDRIGRAVRRVEGMAAQAGESGPRRNEAVAMARCTGRATDGRYPGVLTRWVEDGDTAAWVDGMAVLILPTPGGNSPVLPGKTYHVSPVARQADGLGVVMAIHPPRFRAQLVKKDYDGNCPVYRALRVQDDAGCSYQQALVGPCLDAVYHEQGLDWPTCPPPSPQYSTPDTAEDDNDAGDAAWADPGKARGVADDHRATCPLKAEEETHYLLLTGLCLQIPEAVDGVTVVIDRVKVEVEASASGDHVQDVEIKLVKGGSPTGTSKHTGAALGTSDAVRTYDHTPAEWGVTLTPAEVNAADFGVSLRYRNTNTDPADEDQDRTVKVDWVIVTIYFSPDGVYAPHACVELALGETGDYHLFGGQPWVDLFRPTGDEDDDGMEAYHRRFPDSLTPEDGEEVRLIAAG